MARELIVGILTVTLAALLIVQVELLHAENNSVMEVQVDREQAYSQIQDRMGDHVMISFEQELANKYYFKVTDPENDSIYDVYVNKHAHDVQTLKSEKL